MGATKEQLLAKILSGKARELCSPNGDRKINEAVSNRNSNYNYDPDPNEYNDYEEFDDMYLNEDNNVSRDISYSQENANFSNLPENVKESLIRNPIDRSSLANISVLDGMQIPKQKKQARKPQINEQSMPTNYQQNTNGIDYSIIKAIVTECINEYFSKRPLNESNSINTIGLKAGAIKIVDNKGNVYAAKLEKLGNAKS